MLPGVPPSWNASWISFGQDPRDDLGAFVFRRDFESEGSALEVKVSADQRYRLTLNGEFVGEGPARGDLAHWSYETYLLSPRVGSNRLEALVWSFGRYAPMAQVTYRLAFVLEGTGLSTPEGWVVGKAAGRDFEMLHSEVGPFYIDIGPGELIDLDHLTPNSWSQPNVIGRALERGEWHGDSPWLLVPRAIPAMRRDTWKKPVALADPRTGARRRFEPLTVGPGEPALLDFGELVCGYPTMSAQGPGTLTLTYGESLSGPDGAKGHRDEVVGKRLMGYQDRVTVPVEEAKAEPTLWWRTFRYVKVESDRPARLSEFSATETGYPYEVESSFEASDPWVARIWDVAVHTVRRCAGETYFDCPYYEQLQYAGDTRIQALIHLYLSRDRRLSRLALEHFEWSLLPEGLTQSRYPSRVAQVIPGFSLWWIVALADQALYDTGLEEYDKWNRRAGLVQRILEAYVEGPDHWPFLDWVDEWPLGVPLGGRRHPAAVALFRLACRAWSHMLSWDFGRALSFSDGPPTHLEPDWRLSRLEIRRPSLAEVEAPLSEHELALKLLIARRQWTLFESWPEEPLEHRCSLFFQYYKHLATRPDDYLAELGPWKRMIENGLTTFAETEEPTRSDCHGWSAHPLLGFFQIVAGVTSTAPAWKRALIEPRPGTLEWFRALVAHPDGDLTVAYDGQRLTIDSPVPFDLRWKGRQTNLEAGRHSIG
jgi:hypothetical protein